MKRVKKSSQTILVLNWDPLITATPKLKGTPASRYFNGTNADICCFGSNLVVKSISDEYKIHHLKNNIIYG